MNSTAHGPAWRRVLDELFAEGARVTLSGSVISGEADFDGLAVAVIGTVERAQIGADVALAMARAVLDTMQQHPGRPILLLVDNNGHRLGRWDELMGNNGCIAHLGKCLDVARRRGHKVIGLVCDLAVSGGFMATGMATEACYALPDTELRVMAPEAMARITRIPLDRLNELCASSPVLGPGINNFVHIGGLHGVWEGDPRQHLRHALALSDPEDDPRRRLGMERGGRTLATQVSAMVRAGIEA